MAGKGGRSASPETRPPGAPCAPPAPRSPAAPRSLPELARAHTEAAIATLVEVMGDRGATASARTSAASAILDRGWGRVAQAVEHSGPGGDPVRFDMSRLTDEQLSALEALCDAPGDDAGP